MISVLFLGFLIGLQHALEADHVAAVASIVAHARSMRAMVRHGTVWGLGHALTLLAFGGLILFLGEAIPDSLAQGLEFTVGIVLVLLGADVLRRLARERVHFHRHRHGDGVVHVHAHSHAGETAGHDPARHDHAHPRGVPLRTLFVGMTHGLAGSAALLILALANVSEPWIGILYIVVFGVGATLGMAVLSAAIAVPLGYSARALTWAHRGLQVGIGCVTVLVGALILYATVVTWAADARAGAPGAGAAACQDIEHRYVVGKGQTNARILNFLLFDAAGNDCTELVGRFLDLGAALGARDRFGNTALLIAAHAGENESVRLLLAKGSDVNHENLAGSTALLRAVTMNRRRTAEILIAAGADPRRANRQGIAPVIAAAYNGDWRMVAMLLEAGADPKTRDATGKGPLVYAAGKGYSRIAAMLLDAGIDVNARHGNDLTALMWAAGHSNDVPAAEGLATVTQLLAHGAQLDLADDRGRTALMIAAERGHAEIAAHLVSAGADLAARDKAGRSALDLAADDTVRRALTGS